MKIVHICTAGPVSDGWNYQDNLITKYHKKMGYDVTLVTSRWVWNSDGKLKKTDDSDYINEDGVHVIRLELKGKDTYSKKIKSYKGLLDTLENEKPDILFVHNLQHIDMPKIVKYIKKNPQMKVYVDNHADFSNSANGFLARRILYGIIWRHMAKLIIPYATKFYGVLPARVDFLEEVYKIPKEKTELLVMGADDEIADKYDYDSVRNEFKKEYSISRDDFLIVTGGKIDEAKAQTILLIQAVKEIRDYPVKLLFFGSIADSLKEKVLSLVDGEKIQYIGWIDSVASYKYFSAADLVVFPGRHSVFWEQVAGQGRPMLCKYWDGTTHVNIHDNVRFIKEDSMELIKQQILELLSNSDVYHEMLANAAAVKNEFRYSDIARRSIQMREESINE